MNLINSLQSRINIFENLLKAEKEKVKALIEERSRFIDDWTKLENKFVEFEEAIMANCSDCILKGSDECATCSLNKVAIKYNLWGIE